MTRDALAASAARAAFVLRLHSFALPSLRKSDAAKHRHLSLHPPWHIVCDRRAQGSHPFVPAGLSPVAQDIVHRPQCPIRSTVQTLVSRDPFAGQPRPYGCAKPSFLSTPPVRRACVANDTSVSNKSPPVCGRPPRARSSRWSVFAPACKSSSRPIAPRITLIAASTRIHRSQGEPWRVIEPW